MPPVRPSAFSMVRVLILFELQRVLEVLRHLRTVIEFMENFLAGLNTEFTKKVFFFEITGYKCKGNLKMYPLEDTSKHTTKKIKFSKF